MLTDYQNLRTLRDFVRWGASAFNEAGVFFGHGTDNAIDESLALVLHAVHLDHEISGSYLDTETTDSERRSIVDLFERRIRERIPAPYLIGEATFAGLPFYVNEHVLIPRSPIAELTERRFSPWLDAGAVDAVLDLCTGSGCIAVACAFAFPDARVDGVDVSRAALEVARRNRRRHHLEDHVQLIESDLFADLEGRRYDLIVSNPPYVAKAEMQGLPAEYGWEPVLGLAAGEEGLDLVVRILRDAGRFLSPGGIIVIEVGAAAEVLVNRYPQVPFLWLDFERGGEGVFLLTADQLDEYQHLFDTE
ncbi:MAG: 50S ribosomal protein L3 N(5)-glutamine methyltransferase [Pseudomonadota bacterium]